MAKGRWHAVACLALAPVAGYAGWTLSGGDMPAAVTAAAGCASGVFITPDLDMEKGLFSDHVLNRWTLGLGYVWRLLWMPYTLLAKHRGFSHIPILGTLTRAVYIALAGLIVHVVLSRFTEIDLLALALQYRREIGFLLGGLALADTGHWLMDQF